MTHEELRDIYDRLKESPANADPPAFAAVKAAKAEGRIGIAQEFKLGILVSTWITITTGKDTGTWAWRLWDDAD